MANDQVRLPGLRVGALDYPRVDAALCERARSLATTNVADCMSRLYVVRGLRPMGNPSEVKLCGPALTVRTGPSDNLFVNKALDAAQPGDIVVVDCCGGRSHAYIGEIMARYAQSRGIGGLVIDGPVRDSAELSDLRLPVFAAGVSTTGPWKNGPGELAFPICCGGVPVMPGDLVLGDADGIVIVPRADAVAVIEAAEDVHVSESTTFGDIEAGRMDRAWVDAALRKMGAID
ncbi:MAG TPA: RraA family protein [Bacillota bacterium]|nr:RraA family protein [Bacillota bacterium]